MQPPFLTATAAMAAVLLAANFLFYIPLTHWLNASAFCYPLIYLVCDCTNRLYGPALARRVVLTGFVIGLPMSFGFVYGSSEDALFAARLACASGGAFLASQWLNISVFDKLRDQAWWRAPLISSALASIVDMLIFFIGGFAGSGLPWGMWMLGNFSGKMVMLFAALWLYRVIIARAEQRV